MLEVPGVFVLGFIGQLRNLFCRSFLSEQLLCEMFWRHQICVNAWSTSEVRSTPNPPLPKRAADPADVSALSLGLTHPGAEADINKHGDTLGLPALRDQHRHPFLVRCFTSFEMPSCQCLAKWNVTVRLFCYWVESALVDCTISEVTIN